MKKKILIVIADFYPVISKELLRSAQNELKSFTKVRVIKVPGSFEIPYAVKSLTNTKKFNSIIALGALIKGETIHFETIANSVSISLINISTETLTPVIFGILTTENKKQAIERIKQAIEYAEISVEMGSKKIN